MWRWQQRLAESGIEGLLRDKTRKPGKALLVVLILLFGGGGFLLWTALPLLWRWPRPRAADRCFGAVVQGKGVIPRNAA